MGSIRAVRSGEVGRAWLVAPTVPLRYESELGGEASGLPTHSGRPQLLLPLLPSSSSPHFIHRPLALGPSLNSIGGPSHRHGSVLGVCRAEVGGGSFGSSACLVFVGWGCGCGPARSPSCRSPVFDVLCGRWLLLLQPALTHIGKSPGGCRRGDPLGFLDGSLQVSSRGPLPLGVPGVTVRPSGAPRLHAPPRETPSFLHLRGTGWHLNVKKK